MQLGESTAHWFMADKPLYAKWQREGGDYTDKDGVAFGGNHWASFTPTENKTQWVEMDVTELTKKLIGENTGIYLKNLGGTAPAIAARSALEAPTTIITTATGEVKCPCVEDTYLDKSSSSLGSLAYMHTTPALLKFDYQGVQPKDVTKSVLRFTVISFYTFPVTITADFLDMPPLIDDPAKQGYTVERGIAADVDEKDLTTHADILVYAEMSSLPEIQKTFYVNPAFDYVSLGTGGHSFEPWTDLGITALRVWSNPNQPGILRSDRWLQPKNSASGPANALWKRDFAVDKSLGYDELYLRLIVEVGTDVKAGMTELGMKLFTTNGRYEWGNFTPGIPSVPSAERFEYMLWHGPVSPANPGVYRLCTYDYDVGHSFSANPSNGEIRPTQGYLREGRKYTLEQYVKLNTISGGVPQSNGIHKVWLNGCLVYSDTTRKIRNLPHVQIHGTQAQVYHGGMGKPKATFHYDIGGVAVATKYIGPPRGLL